MYVWWKFFTYTALVFVLTANFFFQSDEITFNNGLSAYSWNYVSCPPENECINGHHTCSLESEVCVDLDEGFTCRCGSGYRAGPNGCEPVCPLGECFSISMG